jgi:hypothetical protein
MGKLINGINGAFSGKVGTVVGYVSNDIAVMRGLAKTKRKNFSEKELNQQARFRLMNEFLIPLKDLLNKTFSHLAFQMVGFNKAFSYNVKAAISGFRPDLNIDYPAVLLSRGDLTKAESAAVISTDDEFVFTWTDNAGKGKSSGKDKVFVAVHHAESNSWFSEMNLAMRSAETCKLPFKKALFAGASFHAYLGFMAEDGKDAADSVYLGMVNVASN